MPGFPLAACFVVVLSAFLSSGLLAGCSTLSPVVTSPVTQIQPPVRPERSLLQSFRIEGRIATRQEDRHLSGKLSWEHSPQRDELLLSTPLGQGMAELSRDAEGARLKLADHREFFAKDWETLAMQLFELPLPLSSFSDWLVGKRPAQARQVERDALGRLHSMTLQDWRIDYLGYESETPDALPLRIELRQRNIEVRLKIDEWELQSPPPLP